MAFSLNYDLNLDTAGYTDLRAQFMVVSAGSLINSGAAIDTGFYEVGSGGYYWEYSNHTDAFFGLVKFYRAAAPSTILGVKAIGPREAENLDAKVSLTATPAQVASAVSLLATASALATTQSTVNAIGVAITALNNLSSAQAQAAAAAALVAYDAVVPADLDAIQSAIDVLIALLAQVRAGVVGRSVADDANDPTEIEYYAEDDTTVLFTHTLTDTERTVA